MSGFNPLRPLPAAPPEKKPVYRVLVLDAAKNVLRTEVLLAHTDAEALALAEAFAWQADVELWDGLRFIEQITARSAPASQRAQDSGEMPLEAS